MTTKRIQKKIAWTPEDKSRHQAIRDRFRGKPSMETLVAEGELSGQPMALSSYLNLRLIVQNLRKVREQAKLSLADVSAKSGIDKAMLSRLENGHVPNPGIETISRYLDALDKSLEWRIVEAPHGATKTAGR